MFGNVFQKTVFSIVFLVFFSKKTFLNFGQLFYLFDLFQLFKLLMCCIFVVFGQFFFVQIFLCIFHVSNFFNFLILERVNRSGNFFKFAFVVENDWTLHDFHCTYIHTLSSDHKS